MSTMDSSSNIPDVSSINNNMVTCITLDDEQVQVPFDVLSVSKTFKEMCENCGIEEADQMVGEFPVRVIRTSLFKKLIDFCRETKDLPEPEIKEDPDTKERIWFNFMDYETEFFNQLTIPELAEILSAANFLNIRRLFLFGCQEAARRWQNKTPEQIRADWGFEDDLSEEEKKKIREENIWCNC